MKGAEGLTEIELDEVSLQGNLIVPPKASGLVIFSHGSGSSRLSTRNQFVASVLRENHLATLLFDLLTEEEDRVYEARFNIDLLTERLVRVTEYLNDREDTSGLRKGLFGASTGAASALLAAAQLKDTVHAVVSRGGRVDMAREHLSQVEAPTLFIVGQKDDVVLQLNQQAYALMHCKKKLEIISGATHLFEEAGALEKVAHLSAEWFSKYLSE